MSMPIHNDDIVKIFNEIADLLEMQNQNVFRIRAYRSAAQVLASLPENVADIIHKGEALTEFPGIGKDLAAKIIEITETGTSHFLEELRTQIPPGLIQLMGVTGLGPKRIKMLYDRLGIQNIEALRKACQDGKIAEIRGFGEKSTKNILDGIDQFERQSGRFHLFKAEEIIRPLITYLKKNRNIKQLEVAGSNRRKRETVRDVDILVTGMNGLKIMDYFVGYEDVGKVLARGETRSSVLLRSDLQVDLRLVPEESFGAALVYFTGSKTHNIAIRKLGIKKNLKINEYGVFSTKETSKDEYLKGETEQDVYAGIDLPFIEPELRENRGEIEAAQQRKLPNLIRVEDIKGDLHMHTDATDGKYSLEEMVMAAKERGYAYIANTDHSQHVKVAKGFDEGRLRAQMKKIDRLNRKVKGIVVLKSIELDILSDGGLDLPDDILKELDLVVCAVHYKFNMTGQEQTDRILRAMDHRFFNILAHPTGRLIGERPPYEVDMEKIMRAAKDRGCALELNAHPYRLDLNDVSCKAAKEMGVKIAISTDAHSVGDLALITYGINQARRGWLEAKDVVNTYALPELRKFLKRH
jgi:DNA polymerase (family X)